MTPAADNENATNPVDVAALIRQHGKKLGPNGIAIVAHLASHAVKRRVTASYEEIGDALGMSRATVIREMKKLEAGRYLSKGKTVRANDTSVWVLSDGSIILTPPSVSLIPPSIKTTPPSVTVIPPPAPPHEEERERASVSNPKPKKNTKSRSNNNRGAVAPDVDAFAGSALSPEAEAFEARLARVTDDKRATFEYLCTMLHSPWRTIDAKALGELEDGAKALFAADPPMTPETLAEAQRGYRALDWQDASGRKIPLNLTMLRRHWSKLIAAVRAGPDDGEQQVAEVIELPKRGKSNGHEPKTFQERRDELHRERSDAIDRLIESELAGDGGSLDAAEARGRLGDSSQGASGGREGSAGPVDPARTTRHLA